MSGILRLVKGPFRSDHFLVHFRFSLQFTLHNIFTCPPECQQWLPNLSYDFPKQKFLKESRFGRKFMVMNEPRYQRFVFIHVFTFEKIFICCLIISQNVIQALLSNNSAKSYSAVCKLYRRVYQTILNVLRSYIL